MSDGRTSILRQRLADRGASLDDGQRTGLQGGEADIGADRVRMAGGRKFRVWMPGPVLIEPVQLDERRVVVALLHAIEQAVARRDMLILADERPAAPAA